MSGQWDAVSAIANSISALIVLAAAIFALMQFRGFAKASQAEALSRMFTEFHSLQAYNNREKAMSLCISSIDNLCTTDKIAIMEVIDLHERYALLARKGYVPKDILLDMYSDLYIRVWNHLQSFICAYRSTAGSVNYGEHFEYFVAISERYRRVKFGEQWNPLPSPDASSAANLDSHSGQQSS